MSRSSSRERAVSAPEEFCVQMHAIGLCQVMSHSRESKCIFGIAAICRVSKPRSSVFGELSFSFASKLYVLVVLTSAIVNCMNEKVKTSP